MIKIFYNKIKMPQAALFPYALASPEQTLYALFLPINDIAICNGAYEGLRFRETPALSDFRRPANTKNISKL